jgi:uncharacterized protein YlzI (FlbEa/FlbD family)
VRSKSKLLPFLIFIFNICIGLLCFYSLAIAGDTFTLFYSLTEGGWRLELSAVDPYKGVEITVNSNISVRYEVIQKIISPIQNQDRPGLILQDNFVFRGLRGTNRFGDLRVPVTDSPVRPEQVLYVSDDAGNPDSFTLAYGIINVEDIEPGYYKGRLAFILNAIGSAQPQVTQVLDVSITISKSPTSKPDIEISLVNGSRYIVLNSQKEKSQSADVLVKINRRFKKAFNILQHLSRPLQSPEGNRLDYAAVNFRVQDVDIGTPVSSDTPLSSGFQNIYSSAAGGEADNSFVVSYNLGDLSAQKAGRYTSNIQYLLEQGGLQTNLESLDLEIENPNIFELLITPLDQKYAIEFKNVKPTEPPRESEVMIEVRSNLGKQYQVSQEVYSELTEKEGNTIPMQYFTLCTVSLDTHGSLKFPQCQEVKKGSSVLLVSDGLGSPDKFKVVYKLECPKDLKAGDYSTRIIYSLSEI